jgi:hypothetical protein
MATPESKPSGLLILLTPPGEHPKVNTAESLESTFTTSASGYLSINGVLGGGSYVSQDKNRQVAILEVSKPGFDNIHQKLMDTSGKALSNSLKPSGGAVQHRLYQMINEKVSPQFDGTPGNILLLVSMQPGTELTEKEFHDWYEQEHTPLFSQIPGWRRTRRAELLDTEGGTGRISRFLALHEWESVDSFNTDQYRHATTTDWQRSVVGRVDQSIRERIVFLLDTDLTQSVPTNK